MPFGYRPYVSPHDATTAVTGDTVDIGGSTDNVYVQVDITGTATVVIEASLTKGTYQTMATLTSSSMHLLDHRIPFYRVRVVTISSGLVCAAYGAIEGRDQQMGVVSPEPVKQGGPV